MSNPVTTFTAAARAFATAAAASAASTTVDPSLLLQLNALPPLCAAAITGLRTISTPEIGNVVTACEVLLALCSQAGDALLAQEPPIQRWVVPEDMPEMTSLQRFYGGDAFAHQAEFESNNPLVLGLILIPGGTALRMAPATV
jgi:hypothetical protein